MRCLIQCTILVCALFYSVISYGQSEDLFMRIWKAKEEVNLSEKSLENFNEFKQEKTELLAQIKQLEDNYYKKLGNGTKDEILKKKILKLYERKHHLIDDIKSQAVKNKDEALFLELTEHVRPKDLKAFLYKIWLNAIQLTAIGSQFKDFVLWDQNGSKVNTVNLKGKVFWIDSWASKCGPCIKKLKQMQSIYKQYHPKGFEILALSWDYTLRGYIKTMDAAKADWIKVMNKHEFNWLNVFDTGDHIMGNKFGSVGKNLLIDEKGIIIGFDLHPLEIEQILEQKYQ